MQHMIIILYSMCFFESSYILPYFHRKLWGINALGTTVVEVEATDGSTGVGVTIGGEPACYVVENHLSRFIEGQVSFLNICKLSSL